MVSGAVKRSPLPKDEGWPLTGPNQPGNDEDSSKNTPCVCETGCLCIGCDSACPLCGHGKGASLAPFVRMITCADRLGEAGILLPVGMLTGLIILIIRFVA